MCVNKWGVGVIFVVVVVFIGCIVGGLEELVVLMFVSGVMQEIEVLSMDCFELMDGVMIDGMEFGVCIVDVMLDMVGYVGKISVMGVEFIVCFNLFEKVIELILFVGLLIVIGDDVWVKFFQIDWQFVDLLLSDFVIVVFSFSVVNIMFFDLVMVVQVFIGEFIVIGIGE